MQNRTDRTKASKPQRIGILVLGMHRAGTSCVTRLLSLLGADLPATLIGASQHNQSGYWESRAVREFNDRLLTSAGSHWSDWRAIGAGWLGSVKATEFKDEAEDLLQAEIGTSRFFVLKDPRICRLAPFWFDVLENAGVTPYAVCVLRNPLEVAASLGARNGFVPEFSHLLWLRHMLDAEALSRGRPRAFVSYDRLLRGWGRVVNRAGEALGLSWPRGPEHIAEEVAGFLSDEKRHHHHSTEDVVENPLLPVWLRDTFRILDTWSAEGENAADYPVLDAIRAEMGATGLAFAPLISLGQKIAEDLRGREDAISKLTAAGQEAKDRAAALEAELTGLQNKTEAGRAKRLRLSSDYDEITKVAEQLRTQIARMETDLATAQAAETAARQQLDAATETARADLEAQALEAETAHKATEARLRAETDVAKGEVAALTTALAEASALAASLSEADAIKATRISELKSARNVAEAAVARLTQTLEAETAAGQARLHAAQTEAARLAGLLEGELTARIDTEARVSALAEADAAKASLIDALHSEKDAAEAAAAALRDQLQEIESALLQRRAETDDANRALQEARATRDAGLESNAALQAELARHHSAAEAAQREAAARIAQLQQDHAAALAEGQVHAQVAARIEAQLQPMIRDMRDSASQHAETEATLRAEKAMLLRENAQLTKAHEARTGETVQLTELLRTAEHDQQVAKTALLDATHRLTAAEDALAAQRKLQATLQTALGAAEAEQIRLAERNAQIEAAARKQASAESALEDQLRAVKDRLAIKEAEQAEEAVRLQATAQRLAEAEDALAAQRGMLAAQPATAASVMQVQSVPDDEKAWQDEQTAQTEADRQYIRDALAAAAGRLWMTKGAKLQRQMATVQKTGLFDAAWYLKINTDVAKAGTDPLRHFVLYGLAEGRAPNSGRTRR